MARFAVLCAALALLANAGPIGGELTRYEFSEPHMGTLVRIVLYAPSARIAGDAAGAAFARIAALDEALSDYRDSSELMRLSRRSGGGPVEVSGDLFRVLRAAQQIARDSAGAFDVTVGPLSVLWRHARRQRELPDGERLTAARALVGHDKLELDERSRTVRLREPGMQLDLGGIAKGFAAEEAATVLRQHGIEPALIAAGGDIVAMQPPPATDGWRIAVASIEGADRPPAGYLTLLNAAVSTSGDAEQFVVIGGVRHSHILDPRTGLALTGRRSVTIVAPNGTMSDGLATAVSVMGAVAGMRLVEATRGAAAFISEAPAAPASIVQTYESSRWRALARGLDPSELAPIESSFRVKTVPASAGRYQECDLERRSRGGLRRSLARVVPGHMESGER
jgi:thiamine biosynthesis lipoprotein